MMAIQALLGILSTGAGAQGLAPVIAPASTSVTAFVGVTESRRPGRPVQVGNWAEFAEKFALAPDESQLAQAVALYFENGGTDPWIVLASGPARVADALSRLGQCNIVCLPGIDDEDALTAAVEFCGDRGAMLLVDPPADCDTAAEAGAWLTNHSDLISPNVAAYVPWVDVAGVGAVPPSGAVAGIFARTDVSRGVWKAPAGVEAGVRGATGPVTSPNDAECQGLNGLNVNALRTMPGRGLVVWGARTLSSNSEWRYVPVRRLGLFLEESISEGTHWVVFEPNDEPLWAKIRTSVGNFMMDLWRQGALQGAKPEEAFFVKCDRETTTAADIDDGVCNVLIGFAPLKPAEFTIIRVQKRILQPSIVLPRTKRLRPRGR
ncbi:MAG TPA: phage tail sheath subtilisin-like domain-containing protein [Armatimonadota bacterium]|nr:phage tail sheath subtilisin-like domain-containing protein [Armatimonadota bacterium]